jgi:hypothetical protein
MFLYFIDLENINVKTPYIPCPIMNQLQWWMNNSNSHSV